MQERYVSGEDNESTAQELPIAVPKASHTCAEALRATAEARYACPGLVRARLLSLMDADHDVSCEVLENEAVQVGNAQGLSEQEVRGVVGPILGRLAERRERINEICTHKTNKEILDEFVRQRCGPDGDLPPIDESEVLVERGPYAIHLGFKSPEQYRRYVDQTGGYTEGGFMDELDGVWTVSNDASGELAGVEKRLRTRLHEEGHAIHALLAREGDTSLGIALEKAKDEVLARLRADPETIPHIKYTMLLRTGTLIMKEGMARRRELERARPDAFTNYATLYADLPIEEKLVYEDTIRAVPSVVTALQNKGYGTEQIVGMLSLEDMRHWKKVAERSATRVVS